jgi:hypothetical protein
MRTNRAPWDYNRRPAPLKPAGLDWLKRHRAWTDEIWTYYQWGLCTRQEWARMLEQGIGWEDYRPEARSN